MQISTKESFIQDEFDKAFHKYKEKKMVLYGIGLRTAMVMPVIKGKYNVIGLMDKEKENIGQLYYGLPILSIEDVENSAEMVIINTAESYWGTIYNRICEMNIPIYFANGRKAEKSIKQNKDLDYWNDSLDQLKARIFSYPVVSFDLYDTLIERRLAAPPDVFSMLELAVNQKIINTRRQAILNLGENYNIEELYDEMRGLDQRISHTEWEQIKLQELQIETGIIVPRKEMVSLYNELLHDGKELYIITDMYLPSEFLIELLSKYDIKTDERHLIVSGYLKKNKSTGTIWKYYANSILAGKSAIHIGDNKKSDVDLPTQYEIDTSYIMSGMDMLKNSSLCEIESLEGECLDMLVKGLIKSRLFNNPYALNKSNGEVIIYQKEDFGYCVWGPIILSFLQWLLENAMQDDIEVLLFTARDGYFILDCFEYLCLEMESEIPVKGKYLAASRRIASVAAIQNEQDFEDVCKLPYIGRFSDYMEDRFEVKIDQAMSKDEINISEDYDKVLDMMRPYEVLLRREISNERQNYRNYLKSVCGCQKCAIVDTGYMGSIQNSIQKLMEKEILGYYFYANLSDDNSYASNVSMKACFQREDDKTAAKSNIYRYLHLIESFLTAPHGMVKYIDDSGQIICNKAGKNQQYFKARETINEGAKEFIHDYLAICKKATIKTAHCNPLFVDELFGKIMDGCKFSEEIKEIFYREDSFLRREEVKIF